MENKKILGIGLIIIAIILPLLSFSGNLMTVTTLSQNIYEASPGSTIVLGYTFKPSFGDHYDTYTMCLTEPNCVDLWGNPTTRCSEHVGVDEGGIYSGSFSAVVPTIEHKYYYELTPYLHSTGNLPSQQKSVHALVTVTGTPSNKYALRITTKDSNGNLLPGVRLYLNDVVRGTTDTSGSFLILDLEGTYKISGTKLMYTSDSKTVSMTEYRDVVLILSEIYECPTLYEPVCGIDGKTYSNSCFADMASVRIDYEGKCVSTDPLHDPEGLFGEMPYYLVVISLLCLVSGAIILRDKK